MIDRPRPGAVLCALALCLPLCLRLSHALHFPRCASVRCHVGASAVLSAALARAAVLLRALQRHNGDDTEEEDEGGKREREARGQTRRTGR